MDADARRHLAKLSDGDARKCLNALEVGVLTTPPVAGVGDSGAVKQRDPERRRADGSGHPFHSAGRGRKYSKQSGGV